ncbi:PREDICTED: uncharacterized protein LOC105128131 isoform X2 [Populus euphratica]|uniref:Man(5)GlcNAc(2)-PP-dolichol translocation protein RFT1 n=1 Tax=Populus euphratica TaxID=75702 RepID=A0AAJ6UEC7_POPEU|nr:PREDICTED: uncharacterized protein LOC105128131 isoform X2 [Populus euphratica]
MFTLCCRLCKLLAEPLYILSQNFLLLKMWLIVETAATFLHCLTMYIILSKQRELSCEIGVSSIQGKFTCYIFQGKIQQKWEIDDIFFIKLKFSGHWFLDYSEDMISRVIFSALFIKHYFQDSSAFSFTSCLPSGVIAAFVESKPEPNE